MTKEDLKTKIYSLQLQLVKNAIIEAENNIKIAIERINSINEDIDVDFIRESWQELDRSNEMLYEIRENIEIKLKKLLTR